MTATAYLSNVAWPAPLRSYVMRAVAIRTNRSLKISICLGKLVNALQVFLIFILMAISTIRIFLGDKFTNAANISLGMWIALVAAVAIYASNIFYAMD